jgi:hypothetical protein
MSKHEYRCEECHWIGTSSQMLFAPNPFTGDSSDTIIGCPNCKAIDPMRQVCDEPGCKDKVTMGSPTPDGYRSTCYAHRPKEQP